MFCHCGHLNKWNFDLIFVPVSWVCVQLLNVPETNFFGKKMCGMNIFYIQSTIKFKSMRKFQSK